MDFSGGGGHEEKQPYAKPAGKVIKHMNLLWPSVVSSNPTYAAQKVVDPMAFASYLNKTFFGTKATHPMKVDDVLVVVGRFMEDLRARRFRLKGTQPVWMAFTRRWQNYPPKREQAVGGEGITVVESGAKPDMTIKRIKRSAS